jgi:hypothetical protein
MASENGWEPSHAGPDILEWRTVPGTNPPVRLQVMKGWPSAIMRAYAADYNAYVEKLRDADSASFTPTNSVATSNHLNGTAMDLNWNSHPFQVSNAGYTPQMIATMREILDFYEDTMFWAKDWNSPKMRCTTRWVTTPGTTRGCRISSNARSGRTASQRSGAATHRPPSAVSKDQYALCVVHH